MTGGIDAVRGDAVTSPGDVNRRFRRRRLRRNGDDIRADEFRDTLRRARGGDEAAVTTLFRLLQPRLVRYLRVLLPADADRLAAETWVEVIERLGAFDGDERGLYALGFAIARRRADAAARAHRDTSSSTEPEPFVDDAADVQVDDDGMAGLGLRSALAAISRLPRDQAEVVVLRVLGELSVDQVADLLDQPAESVGALQVQALRTLNWLTSTAGAAS
jgi:RNA polymerase sigma-70 factor (ECF subfamily)